MCFSHKTHLNSSSVLYTEIVCFKFTQNENGCQAKHLIYGAHKETQQGITVAVKLINYYSPSMHAATVIILLLLQQNSKG